MESEPPSLIAGSGAMQDVNLLECCLAYHEKDLYLRGLALKEVGRVAARGMHSLGFEPCTIFYGAFMRQSHLRLIRIDQSDRWYATFLPTATVFRLWDAILFQSTNPKSQSLGGRDFLIDLAFASMRAKRNELMDCESAFEMSLGSGL